MIISFTASEALTGTPTVTVGSRDAALQRVDGQSYAFVRTIDGSEGEGAVVVRVSGEDLAGNQGVDNSGRLTTDFTRPYPSAFELNPSAGREGTEIVLSFATSETLTSTPRVSISSQPFVFIGVQNGRYAFSRVLDRREGEGMQPTRIELVDPASNSSITSGPAVRTDFTSPTVTDFSVSPVIGTTGTAVTIRVVASEALAEPPAVKLGGREATLASSAPPVYIFSRTLSGQESEGDTRASVQLDDLVANVSTSDHSGFRADFTAPRFTNIQIGKASSLDSADGTTPPAHVATTVFSVGSHVVVTITASEPLAGLPTVGARPYTLLSQDSLRYTFTRQVEASEAQGDTSILIEGTDLVGIVGRDSSASFRIDFDAPRALDVRVAPSPATIGTTVTVSFTVSEELGSVPVVSVGDQPASLSTVSGRSYDFSRVLDATETEGMAGVDIELADLAGNVRRETAASLVLDFTPPKPVIGAFPNPGREGSLIAFDSRTTTDGTTIAKTIWSFGTEATATSAVAVHTFEDGPSTHVVELTVTDSVGLTASATLRLPIINVTPTVALDAIPNIVSGVVPLTWRTNEPGARDLPTVTVLAQDLKVPLRTQLADQVPDKQRVDWDTRASKESLFQITVTSRDKDGAQSTAAYSPVIVNNRPLTIATGGAQPRCFNPNFDEPTALTYTLSEHATVSVKVVRSTDRSTIATLVADSSELEGSHAVPWTGRDAAGQVLPDGQYAYIIDGFDLIGNRVSASSLDAGFVIVLDTVAPQPPQVNPVSSFTKSRVLTLGGSKETGTGIRILSDASTPLFDAAPDDSTTWSATVILTEGVNRLNIFARDRASNLSTPVTVLITLDTMPPARPIITSAVPSTTVADTLTIDGTKDAGSALVVNGTLRNATAATTWSERFDLRAGSNSFAFQAVDDAGNVSDTTFASTFRTPNDVSPPTVNASPTSRFTTTTVSGTKQKGADITLQSSDTGPSVSLPVSQATEWSLVLSLPIEEVNSFVAFSTDSIGSKSAQVPFAILRDTQAPTISLAAGLASKVTTNTSITVGVSYDDIVKSPDLGGSHTLSGINSASARLKLDGADITTQATVTATGATALAKNLAIGSHRVDGSVADNSGNVSTISGSFYVVPPDNGSPPVVTITKLANGVFSPAYNAYDPEHEARCRLDFTVDVPVTASLAVKSRRGASVRTISIPMSFPGTVHSIFWDGKDAQGNPMLDGSYGLYLTVVNSFGRTTNVSPSVVEIHY